MLIYLETKAKSYPLAQQIISQFPSENIVEIQHYKNFFDKKIGDFPLEPCLILAKQDSIALLDAPQHYGYLGKNFFFKPMINCIFDCDYCYLKGTFRNRFPVIFVNYEDFQQQISSKIMQIRQGGYEGQIAFYASNYADLLALDHLTHFHESFLPFFEQFDRVLMETRTKSVNIENLKKIGNLDGVSFPHTEVSFSLSPQEVTEQYEKKTASLFQKLEAIQTLLTYHYQIGLRFLPLLPLEHYETVYENFLKVVTSKLDCSKIHSLFIAPLIYNEGDYQALKKIGKLPFLDVLQNDHGLMKMPPSYYDFFLQLFQKYFPGFQIFWDYR